MEDIIKELYEFIDDRFLADMEVMLKESIELNDKIWSKKNIHRFTDIQDLMTSYSNFRDRLEKVKNNIDYDKHH